MLTLNVLADVDLTELIRNLQPQKLCLCYPVCFLPNNKRISPFSAKGLQFYALPFDRPKQKRQQTDYRGG